jgi:hypothetical protein
MTLFREAIVPQENRLGLAWHSQVETALRPTREALDRVLKGAIDAVSQSDARGWFNDFAYPLLPRKLENRCTMPLHGKGRPSRRSLISFKGGCPCES